MINVKRQPGLPAHCETMLRNSDCPYLKLGCTGCCSPRMEAAMEAYQQYLKIMKKRRKKWT